MVGLENFRVGAAESLRIDDDADIHRKGALDLVEVEVDRHHPTDFDAKELHWRIDLEPAQRLIKA